MRWKYTRSPWKKQLVFITHDCGVCLDTLMWERMYHKVRRGSEGYHSCYCNGNENGHKWHCQECHTLYLLKQRDE